MYILEIKCIFLYILFRFENWTRDTAKALNGQIWPMRHELPLNNILYKMSVWLDKNMQNEDDNTKTLF